MVINKHSRKLSHLFVFVQKLWMGLFLHPTVYNVLSFVLTHFRIRKLLPRANFMQYVSLLWKINNFCVKAGSV